MTGVSLVIIVGEKINTSRKEVKEAVEKRDAGFIRGLARRQLSWQRVRIILMLTVAPLSLTNRNF